MYIKFTKIIFVSGACVDGEGRTKFDVFFRALLAGEVQDVPEYLDFKSKNPEYDIDYGKKSSVALPEGGEVYDYIFDSKQARWLFWLEGKQYV
jgi:hypothetical protein